MWTAPEARGQFYPAGCSDSPSTFAYRYEGQVGEKGSRIKGTRGTSPRGPRLDLLRKEPGRSAILIDRTVDGVRAEPDPAVAEAEDRRAREDTTGLRSELVSGTVDVELFPPREASGVREEHAPHTQRTVAELILAEGRPGTTHRLAAVAKTELCRDDEDVALLLCSDLLEHHGRPRVLAQTIRRDLTFAVVVEAPRLLDLPEDEFDRAAVPHGRILDPWEEASRERLDRRDGEPSFGTLGEGERRQPFHELGRGTEREAEERHQPVDLLADGRRARVLGRVDPRRCDLLVRVLLAHRQPHYRGSHRIPNHLTELTTVLDDELCLILVEVESIHNLARCRRAESTDLILLSRRDPCGHRPPPVLRISESLGAHD